MLKNLQDKIVISDTSCLIHLEKSGFLYVLPILCKEVFITKEVAGEYFIKGVIKPDWLKVVDYDYKKVEFYDSVVMWGALHKGELSSLVYAKETKDSLLVIDEKKGRKCAERFGIKITGIAGILLDAFIAEIIDDFDNAVDKLIEKGFRISKKEIEEMIDMDKEARVKIDEFREKKKNQSRGTSR
jgi:predicted nucleic acid-binding protein